MLLTWVWITMASASVAPALTLPEVCRMAAHINVTPILRKPAAVTMLCKCTNALQEQLRPQPCHRQHHWILQHRSHPRAPRPQLVKPQSHLLEQRLVPLFHLVAQQRRHREQLLTLLSLLLGLLLLRLRQLSQTRPLSAVHL